MPRSVTWLYFIVGSLSRMVGGVRSIANMARETLGGRVRRARVEAGFGLRELARRLGKTPSYLSDIENDRRVLYVRARTEHLLRGEQQRSHLRVAIRRSPKTASP